MTQLFFFISDCIFHSCVKFKITKQNTKMKTEEKSNVPKVRIAVLGQMNVGKSGKLKILIFCAFIKNMFDISSGVARRFLKRCSFCPFCMKFIAPKLIFSVLKAPH